jgi:hypothetical protein
VTCVRLQWNIPLLCRVLLLNRQPLQLAGCLVYGSLGLMFQQRPRVHATDACTAFLAAQLPCRRSARHCPSGGLLPKVHCGADQPQLCHLQSQVRHCNGCLHTWTGSRQQCLVSASQTTSHSCEMCFANCSVANGTVGRVSVQWQQVRPIAELTCPALKWYSLRVHAHLNI